MTVRRWLIRVERWFGRGRTDRSFARTFDRALERMDPIVLHLQALEEERHSSSLSLGRRAARNLKDN